MLRQVPQKDVKENPEVIGEFGGIETEVKTALLPGYE